MTVVNRIYIHTICPSCKYEFTCEKKVVGTKSTDTEIECCMCGYKIIDFTSKLFEKKGV